jgi:beta-mannosidase
MHMCSSLLVLRTFAVGVAADTSLRDQPIAASASPTYLDGDSWTASTLLPPTRDHRGQQQQQQPSPKINITVAATVPGDLLTDLQRASVIADPWLDTTWMQNSSLWSDHAWTYTTSFSVSGEAAAARSSTLLLTFDGVKMGATVRVNGRTVGVVHDQFLRYVFTLDPTELGLVAGAGANRLDITFGVGDVAEDGRFMACTGGWDWAPYSYTSTNSSGATSGSAATFSKGIWKSVYLTEVPAATAAITHVTPHTHYIGAYPTARLVDGEHGGFSVNVTAHLWAPPGGATGILTVAGSWAGAATVAIGDSEATDSSSAVATSGATTLPARESMISLQLTASAAQIKLWWPAGVGGQPLYNVSATWTPTKVVPAAAATLQPAASAGSVTATSRRMGFRVFAVVTVNDTNATVVGSNASQKVTGQVSIPACNGTPSIMHWCTSLVT